MNGDEAVLSRRAQERRAQVLRKLAEHTDEFIALALTLAEMDDRNCRVAGAACAFCVGEILQAKRDGLLEDIPAP